MGESGRCVRFWFVYYVQLIIQNYDIFTKKTLDLVFVLVCDEIVVVLRCDWLCWFLLLYLINGWKRKACTLLVRMLWYIVTRGWNYLLLAASYCVSFWFFYFLEPVRTGNAVPYGLFTAHWYIPVPIKYFAVSFLSFLFFTPGMYRKRHIVRSVYRAPVHTGHYNIVSYIFFNGFVPYMYGVYVLHNSTYRFLYIIAYTVYFFILVLYVRIMRTNLQQVYT